MSAKPSRTHHYTTKLWAVITSTTTTESQTRICRRGIPRLYHRRSIPHTSLQAGTTLLYPLRRSLLPLDRPYRLRLRRLIRVCRASTFRRNRLLRDLSVIGSVIGRGMIRLCSMRGGIEVRQPCCSALQSVQEGLRWLGTYANKSVLGSGLCLRGAGRAGLGAL